MLRLRLEPRRLHLPRGASGCRRLHDQGVWGYQAPHDFTLPDFDPHQLANRARNASLLRLVESYRRHGHRAALVDPLDLAKRPNVPALDPRRYGFSLTPDAATKLRDEFVSEAKPLERVSDEGDKFNVSGILDFPKSSSGGTTEERTMDEIATRLAEVYCGGIAYEVRPRLFPLALSRPLLLSPPSLSPSASPFLLPLALSLVVPVSPRLLLSNSQTSCER